MIRLIRTAARALTNDEIRRVYELAEQHNVGLCPWQDTPVPSQPGATIWGARGAGRHVRRLLRALAEEGLR